jgi:deoxyribonuclease V
MNDSGPGRFKLCVDVQYSEDSATVAGVLFRNWDDSIPVDEVTICTGVPSGYEPGGFYKRELPCIMELLSHLPQQPELIVIDGYVWLGPSRPGLGHHLFVALGGATAVVGIAKNRFVGLEEVSEVLRGGSKRPLFVTTEGIDRDDVAGRIAAMQGAYRIPTLIKRADQLCRFPVKAADATERGSVSP